MSAFILVQVAWIFVFLSSLAMSERPGMAEDVLGAVNDVSVIKSKLAENHVKWITQPRTIQEIPINASPIAPSEKHVHQILCMLADKRLRPLYFHCSVGRDRTSLIATLYELNYLNLPAKDAWEEMKRFGFKDDWTLRGLKDYLLNHLSLPAKPGKDGCDPIPVPH